MVTTSTARGRSRQVSPTPHDHEEHDRQGFTPLYVLVRGYMCWSVADRRRSGDGAASDLSGSEALLGQAIRCACLGPNRDMLRKPKELRRGAAQSLMAAVGQPIAGRLGKPKFALFFDPPEHRGASDMSPCRPRAPTRGSDPSRERPFRLQHPIEDDRDPAGPTGTFVSLAGGRASAILGGNGQHCALGCAPVTLL